MLQATPFDRQVDDFFANAYFNFLPTAGTQAGFHQFDTQLEDYSRKQMVDAQTEALLALLDPDYVQHQLVDRGQDLETLGDAWESLARKLCGQ